MLQWYTKVLQARHLNVIKLSESRPGMIITNSVKRFNLCSVQDVIVKHLLCSQEHRVNISKPEEHLIFYFIIIIFPL